MEDAVATKAQGHQEMTWWPENFCKLYKTILEFAKLGGVL